MQVVTDSTADLPDEMAATAGIKVIPLSIRFGDHVYLDGVNLSKEAFYRMLRETPSLPTTSVPSPGMFAEAYREALEAGRKVISIHLSGLLSGTYNSALLAAAEFPEGQIAVVDSRNGSMAHGWMALAAAEAARTGATLAAVKGLVEDMIPRAHLYACLDTLENLRRFGRIGRAQAFLGTMLNVKPIVTIGDGIVTPVEKVRLLSKALVRLVDIAVDHAPIERMAVAHTDAPETVARLRQLIEEAIPGLPTITYRAGSVVGTLAG
ncbi:MAG: DegV family protein, partial [Chloroflexota bacterium]